MKFSSFDQGAYWHKRAESYDVEFSRHSLETQRDFRLQEQQLKVQLAGLADLAAAESLLEVGCGFGRLTAILLESCPNAVNYLGVDISPHQVDRARSAHSNVGLELEFAVADIRHFVPERQFDAVFAGEVLLHLPPHEVLAVMDTLRSLARVQVVHLDPFLAPPEPRVAARIRQRVKTLASPGPRRWAWCHDYPRLWAELGVRSLQMRPVINGRQHLFVVTP